MVSISSKTKEFLNLVSEKQTFGWYLNFISKDGFSRPRDFLDEDDKDLGWNSEELEIIRGLEAVMSYYKHLAAKEEKKAEAFLSTIEACTPILRWWTGLDKTFPQKRQK